MAMMRNEGTQSMYLKRSSQEKTSCKRLLLNDTVAKDNLN